MGIGLVIRGVRIGVWTDVEAVFGMHGAPESGQAGKDAGGTGSCRVRGGCSAWTPMEGDGCQHSLQKRVKKTTLVGWVGRLTARSTIRDLIRVI